MSDPASPAAKKNFWTKNYWRSAFIAFAVSGTFNQMSADNPEMNSSLLVMAVIDLSNVAFIVFLVAAILRFIKSKKTAK